MELEQLSLFDLPGDNKPVVTEKEKKKSKKDQELEELRLKVQEFETARPERVIEKVVEKIVEKPVVQIVEVEKGHADEFKEIPGLSPANSCWEYLKHQEEFKDKMVNGKSVSGMDKYILKRAKAKLKSTSGSVPSIEVLGWAKHYLDEPDEVLKDEKL